MRSEDIEERIAILKSRAKAAASEIKSLEDQLRIDQSKDVIGQVRVFENETTCKTYTVILSTYISDGGVTANVMRIVYDTEAKLDYLLATKRTIGLEGLLAATKKVPEGKNFIADIFSKVYGEIFPFHHLIKREPINEGLHVSYD